MERITKNIQKVKERKSKSIKGNMKENEKVTSKLKKGRKMEKKECIMKRSQNDNRKVKRVDET